MRVEDVTLLPQHGTDRSCLDAFILVWQPCDEGKRKTEEGRGKRETANFDCSGMMPPVLLKSDGDTTVKSQSIVHVSYRVIHERNNNIIISAYEHHTAASNNNSTNDNNTIALPWAKHKEYRIQSIDLIQNTE